MESCTTEERTETSPGVCAYGDSSSRCSWTAYLPASLPTVRFRPWMAGQRLTKKSRVYCKDTESCTEMRKLLALDSLGTRHLSPFLSHCLFLPVHLSLLSNDPRSHLFSTSELLLPCGVCVLASLRHCFPSICPPHDVLCP